MLYVGQHLFSLRPHCPGPCHFSDGTPAGRRGRSSEETANGHEDYGRSQVNWTLLNGVNVLHRRPEHPVTGSRHVSRLVHGDDWGEVAAGQPLRHCSLYYSFAQRSKKRGHTHKKNVQKKKARPHTVAPHPTGGVPFTISDGNVRRSTHERSLWPMTSQGRGRLVVSVGSQDRQNVRTNVVERPHTSIRPGAQITCWRCAQTSSKHGDESTSVVIAKFQGDRSYVVTAC